MVESVSPDFHLKGDDRRGRLLFLAGGLFGGDRRFFLGGGGGDFGFFLAGLLLVGFGGFVAHDVFSFGLPQLTRLRNESFPEGAFIMRAGGAVVNSGGKFILGRGQRVFTGKDNCR